LTKKQKEEFIELYKKTKTTSPTTGDGPRSTKPSDFEGAPISGVSMTPSESKLLPCESYVDQWLTTLCSPSTIGGVVAATITQVDQHRDKVGSPLIPYVCTCRPVDRKEIEEKPKATQAMQSEWDRLRSRKAWDESNPREWSDVAREARQGGHEVRVGMIFGFVVEKNSDLPAGDARRTFTGRAVFQGNNVKNQNWECSFCRPWKFSLIYGSREAG
jgi:hypothetical protein